MRYFILMSVLLAAGCAKKEPEPCFVCVSGSEVFRSVGAPLNTPLPQPGPPQSATVCSVAERDRKMEASPSLFVLGAVTVVLSTTCRAQ